MSTSFLNNFRLKGYQDCMKSFDGLTAAMIITSLYCMKDFLMDFHKLQAIAICLSVIVAAFLLSGLISILLTQNTINHKEETSMQVSQMPRNLELLRLINDANQQARKHWHPYAAVLSFKGLDGRYFRFITSGEDLKSAVRHEIESEHGLINDNPKENFEYVIANLVIHAQIAT